MIFKYFIDVCSLSNPQTSGDYTYYECKHYGCNKASWGESGNRISNGTPFERISKNS